MPSKLEKFAELETLDNCHKFHLSNIADGFSLKGKWKQLYFKNSNPIVVELGCGKGEYTIGLAEQHPENNYIGVDVKGNRIWTGAMQAKVANLQNVSFLRTKIDLIEHCFSGGEVDEIWITFPDPQPQKPRARQRLTHPIFLERYKRILKPNGVIHLKTDSTLLYEFTLNVIHENNLKLHWYTNNLYENCPAERGELIAIKTYYEKLFAAKGEDIKYINFSF
jgi:tRNA (guanine-N7-)-methyltransferase